MSPLMIELESRGRDAYHAISRHVYCDRDESGLYDK